MKRTCSRWSLAILRIAALMLAWQTTAFAQSTVSQIRGMVFDQTGNPLAGVRIVATSPTNIGGAKTAYTDAEGNFRIINLNPGVYELAASSAGLASVVQKGIELSVNAPSEANFVLEVASKQDTVKIVDRVVSVVATAANVKETFTQDFIEKATLPAPTYQDMADQAVGWNKTGRDQRVRGGNISDNNYTVDGFNIQDPVNRGGRQLVPHSSVSMVEVQAAAYGAENANAQGGVLNVVAKTGSNDFHFSASGTYQDGRHQFWKDKVDADSSNTISFLNLDLGGPIVRDKLWFYVAGEASPERSKVGPQAAGLIRDYTPPERDILALRFLGKLTFQATPRNKISLLGTFAPERTNNAVQNHQVAPQAERHEDLKYMFAGLSWHAALDSFLIVNQASVNQVIEKRDPQLCQTNPSQCYEIANDENRHATFGTLRTKNWEGPGYESIGRNYQFNSSVEWFNQGRTGAHDAKFGIRLNHFENPYKSRVPGDARIITTQLATANAPVNSLERKYCANDPRLGGDCQKGWTETNTKGQTGTLFLQDAWKPTQYLTLNPGVALSYGNFKDPAGNRVIDVLAPTPHISAVWDPTHDGKTAFRASFAGYVDTGFLAVARYAAASPYFTECAWNPATNQYDLNCTAGGGASQNTVGKPCGPTETGPDGKPCSNKANPTPRTWELTFGGEREVIPGAAFGFDFIYRKYQNQFEDAETNRIWNGGGTGLAMDGGFKNGRDESILDLSARPENHRTYRGVTVFLRKYVGDMQLLLAWTRHQQYGSPLTFNSAFLTNPSQALYYYGYITTEQRNEAKIMGNYKLTKWFTIGTNCVYRNGNPWDRSFYNAVTNARDSLRSAVGTDPRNINDADDDFNMRTGDVFNVFLQFRLKLQPLIKQNAEVWLDVFNVAQNRDVTTYNEEDSTNYNRISARRAPPYIRFGARYSY